MSVNFFSRTSRRAQLQSRFGTCEICWFPSVFFFHQPQASTDSKHSTNNSRQFTSGLYTTLRHDGWKKKTGTKSFTSLVCVFFCTLLSLSPKCFVSRTTLRVAVYSQHKFRWVCIEIYSDRFVKSRDNFPDRTYSSNIPTDRGRPHRKTFFLLSLILISFLRFFFSTLFIHNFVWYFFSRLFSSPKVSLISYITCDWVSSLFSSHLMCFPIVVTIRHSRKCMKSGGAEWAKPVGDTI